METEITRELLQEMETACFGKPGKPKAVFTTGKLLNVDASFAAGHRVERAVPYLALKFAESRDSISKPATKKQIAQYPEAFAAYQEDIRRGNQTPYEGWEGLGSPHARQSNRSVEVLRPVESGDCRTYDNLEALDRTG